MLLVLLPRCAFCCESIVVAFLPLVMFAPVLCCSCQAIFRKQTRPPSNRAWLGGLLPHLVAAGPPEVAEVDHLCTRAGKHRYMALQVCCLLLHSP